MSNKRRSVNWVASLLVLSIATFLPHTAMAQVDITGYWDSLLHSDYAIRLWGPEPRDYGGLPLTQAGRAAGDAFDPNSYFLPENQCRHHGGGYVMRGPFPKHFSWEDENTLLIRIELEAQERRVYMDGRSYDGPHTSMGHSLGVWNGDKLTVRTTHMIPYFIRRNGVPYSEDAVMTEHFVSHGAYMTLTTILEDPLYLTEPLVRSIDFKKIPDSYGDIWTDSYPCDVVEWPGGAPGELLPN